MDRVGDGDRDILAEAFLRNLPRFIGLMFPLYEIETVNVVPALMGRMSVIVRL